MKSRFSISVLFAIVVLAGLVSFDQKDERSILKEHQQRSQAFFSGTYLCTPPKAINIKYPEALSITSLPIPEEEPFTPVAKKMFYGGESYENWKEALAFKESQGKYNLVNRLGYMGKYQFGRTTLRGMGVTDTKRFMQDPYLQEETFLKYVKYNFRELEPLIEKYEGQEIGGVMVTKSGVLAAAHLSGAGGVRKFLETQGEQGKKDAFGTSIRSYMTKFGGYDLNIVIN